MIQNIKVDIIYYLMGSDFEMEFNLCGCCRMRLLTDKAKDKRSLVEDMSKAVSRSRVTIICGPLFSEEGLINITAKATNRRLVTVDNKEYGINSDGEVNIVAGAIPLVTRDGIFGGLIMESGPQTIILLTEAKSVRKDIMQTLIHPYIEELSIIPERRGGSHLEETAKDEEPIEDISSGKHLETPAESSVEEISSDSQKSEENAEETVEETIEETPEAEVQEEVVEETTQQEPPAQEEAQESGKETETEEETEEETQEAGEEETAEPSKQETQDAADGEIMFVFPDYEDDDGETDIEPQDDYDSGFFIEPKRVSFKAASNYANSYVPSKKDEMFISDLEETYDKIKKEKKINVWLIVILATLGLLVAFIVYYLVIVPLFEGVPFSTYYNDIFGLIE